MALNKCVLHNKTRYLLVFFIIEVCSVHFGDFYATSQAPPPTLLTIE